MNQINQTPVETESGILLYGQKDYAPVATRLNQARSENKNWSNLRDVIFADGFRCVTRARFFSEDGRILATGHAEELYNASPINIDSAMPCGETSATGRAMAFLGYLPSQYDLNPVEIDGRMYPKVLARVAEFRAQFPNFSVITEIIRHFPHYYLVRCTILDEKGRAVSNAHMEGWRSPDTRDVRYLSLLEDIETSSVGRALGFFLAFRSPSTAQIATAEEIMAARARRAEYYRSQQQPSLPGQYPHGSYQQPLDTPPPLPVHHNEPVYAPQYHEPDSDPVHGAGPSNDQASSPAQNAPAPSVGPAVPVSPASPEEVKKSNLTAAKHKAREIANQLIGLGFKDETAGNVDRNNPPAHACFFGEIFPAYLRVVVYCPLDCPLSPQLQQFRFGQDMADPAFWYLDFRY